MKRSLPHRMRHTVSLLTTICVPRMVSTADIRHPMFPLRTVCPPLRTVFSLWIWRRTFRPSPTYAVIFTRVSSGAGSTSALTLPTTAAATSPCCRLMYLISKNRGTAVRCPYDSLAFLTYCIGVMPSLRRKQRIRLHESPNPHCSATCCAVSPVRNSSMACLSRHPAT